FPRHPPPFPTRRSSDLREVVQPRTAGNRLGDVLETHHVTSAKPLNMPCRGPRAHVGSHASSSPGLHRNPSSRPLIGRTRSRYIRSEEHTSELQSRENLV